MREPFMPANFCDATFRSKIAAKDDKSTGLLERPVEWRDDFLSWSFDGAFAFCLQAEPAHCHRRTIQVASAKKASRKQADATGTMHVRRDKAPRWFQISEKRSPFAHGLEMIDL